MPSFFICFFQQKKDTQKSILFYMILINSAKAAAFVNPVRGMMP